MKVRPTLKRVLHTPIHTSHNPKKINHNTCTFQLLVFLVGWEGEDIIGTQGRSQPHSSGWARVPLSSFFPQISIIFHIFSQTFLIFFLILALLVGESPTLEGPGYPNTHILYLIVSSKRRGFRKVFSLDQRLTKACSSVTNGYTLNCKRVKTSLNSK